MWGQVSKFPQGCTKASVVLMFPVPDSHCQDECNLIFVEALCLLHWVGQRSHQGEAECVPFTDMVSPDQKTPERSCLVGRPQRVVKVKCDQ